MANTFVVSRNHLVFGLCLPLAVLLGYLLADPLESSSLSVLVMILTVLLVPVLLKWHHTLLIISWNLCLSPLFLPGKPQLWMLMSFVSLTFGLRLVHRKFRWENFIEEVKSRPRHEGQIADHRSQTRKKKQGDKPPRAVPRNWLAAQRKIAHHRRKDPNVALAPVVLRSERFQADA